MHITFFSVWMTVLWSSILILIFYVLRTKYQLIDICSVSGVIVLYLFCMIRMIIPVEFPWTKIVFGGELYNRIYYFSCVERNIGNDISVFDLLCLLWYSGTFLIILRYVIQYVKIARFFGGMPVQRNSNAAQIVDAVWNGSKKPDIIQTAAVRTPCCFGILRKKIIIPDKPYTEEQLRFILLHECSHLLNHDILVKNLINILCALYWWNPCVYLLKKDLSQSLEIRCDLTAVKELGHQLKGDYLAVILSEYKDSLEDANSAGLHYDNPKLLLERFQLVADERRVLVKKGNIPAWVISGCLLFISYSFIFQTEYEAPKEDIETEQDAYEINADNSYLIKTDDGTYFLHIQNKDIAISEEVAQMMIKDGFTVIVKSEK
ncbi:MAG: M56 family metallopeptidase [Lachnospiraceae bacterium]|nr:M56 family metallopeptidase [Lachnospiraceae bacterium]